MAAKNTCLVCQIIDNSIPSKKIYEDEFVMAVLDVNGAVPGHCFIMPKKHYPIIEQVPDVEIGRLSLASNKISSAIFESLGAQGTNIFIANGIPAGQTVAHFTINVIPRRENDGVNLQWQPKQLNEEEISTIELKLKEQTKNIGHFEKEEKKPRAHAPKTMPLDEEEEEHFAAQMRRLP
ncbi:HIT domain-containing protein [Candidatus Woesearchaeota archaeon]|nr:HIT domain-containing protein [Candidatus Woesearchaeota archaeon]